MAILPVFGKKIGGDILCNKKTYMLIKALERADKAQLSELNDWLAAESFSPEEKIAAVTALYNQIGIKAIAKIRCGNITPVLWRAWRLFLWPKKKRKN